MFSKLGVGVGLRPKHYAEFLANKPRSVSWVEVITENFLESFVLNPGRAIQTLEKIRQDYPVVLHGVSLNIGSVDALDRTYLNRLRNLIDRIEPALVSDHLSWTGVDGENLHDLFPVPHTKEALDLIVRKVKRVQDFLGRRIILENPSTYVSVSGSEMSEAEFLGEVARRADCGILLDVNNVFVSAKNHGFAPLDYLRSIPQERVGQIHLAGHSRQGNLLVDTHDAPVCEEVWALYDWTVRNFGPRSAMIERDCNIPEWEELESELARLGRIHYGKHENASLAAMAAAI